jgi:nucleoid-associated protein YgaU
MSGHGVAIDDSAAAGRALPPPDLENAFAQTLMPLRAQRAGDLERFPPADAADEEDASRRPRTRVVVDGDSLRSLAQRYLGSSDRYMEIYEANRDVLASPDLLRIGMRLRIPSNSPKASEPSEYPTTKAMVEIKE